MQQLFETIFAFSTLTIAAFCILSVSFQYPSKVKQIQAPSSKKNLRHCKKCATNTNSLDHRGETGADKSNRISKEETKPKVREKIDETKLMKEFEESTAKLVGLKELKLQLQNWARGILLDEKRRAMNIPIRKRVVPHMVFMGNPGTGKTMVANIIGEILHRMGLLKTKKVTVVQRTDLVAEYIGHTGPKTRQKIKEAHGGVLFVDEAYRLIVPRSSKDFGREALEEIMSFMDTGEIVVVFAGYSKSMRKVIDSNEGFRRRVTKFFYFVDYTTLELAEILHSKVTMAGSDNLMKGYKLEPSCTLENISELISRETTAEFRSKRNGGLVNSLLQNARENLDARLDLHCNDVDAIVTITMEDLEKGLKQLCKEGDCPVVTEASDRKKTSCSNMYI